MKPTPKVPRRTKLDTVNLNSQGNAEIPVAHSLGISRSTLQRAKKKLADHGDVEGGKKKVGPKAELSPGMLNVNSFLTTLIPQSLLQMVLSCPDRYLDEYAREVEKRFEVKLAPSTIYRIFEKNEINRKKVLFPYYQTNYSLLKRHLNVTKGQEILGYKV
jgi:transposase